MGYGSRIIMTYKTVRLAKNIVELGIVAGEKQVEKYILESRFYFKGRYNA